MVRKKRRSLLTMLAAVCTAITCALAAVAGEVAYLICRGVRGNKKTETKE